jgi:glycosyltransferase involved in cell wall biosynthesis
MALSNLSRSDKPVADICLILEGSYPYVHGGVSGWADQLIRSFPDRTFHLWCLVANKKDITLRYKLPDNVVDITNVVIFDYSPEPVGSPHRKLWDTVHALYAQRLDLDAFSEIFWGPLQACLPRAGSHLPIRKLLLGEQAYTLYMKFYAEQALDGSLIDSYYAFLYMLSPLLRLLTVDIPPARLYHAISTGYAGFVGCRARRQRQAPLLLTEHGIYTSERRVEISMAEWIYAPRDGAIHLGSRDLSLKKIWIDLFDFLGRMAYREADHITTLCGGNRDLQVRLGAPRQKIEIIPNGVKLSTYGNILRANDPDHPLIGLVGRVVPIKDIRTFIKACRVVAEALPQARFLVLGSIDQDPEYYQKCLEYRKLADLESKLTLTGNVSVNEYYPRLDVVVLTSVSEAMPLTVLEAMACGIPVVATRVGACEELLNGRDPADRQLGTCGLTADVADNEAIGRAIVRVLSERNLAAAFGCVGKERIRTYYDAERVDRQYARLYDRWLETAGVG